MKDLPAPTRRVERGEHLEMFPKNDPSRQDRLGIVQSLISTKNPNMVQWCNSTEKKQHNTISWK